MLERLLVNLAATFFAVGGLALLFIPDTLQAAVQPNATAPTGLWLSLLGAAYWAMAVANWTARHAPLGGIYGRAIVLLDFTYLSVGGLVLFRAALDNAVNWPGALLAGLFLVTAAAFGWMLWGSPGNQTTGQR